MSLKTLTGVFLVLLTASQCSSAKHANPKEDKNMNPRSESSAAFTGIGQGSATWRPSQGSFGPQVLIIESQAGWEKLSRLFPMRISDSSATDFQNLSKLDFTREKIWIFTYGLVGSSGYSIRLEKITVTEKARFFLKGVAPDPGDDVGAVMDHPFHLIVVKGLDPSLPMEFLVNGKPISFGVTREN